MGIRINTRRTRDNCSDLRSRLTVPTWEYRLKISIADVHDLRRARKNYPLNHHTIVMTLGLLLDAWVFSQQPALIFEDQLSKNAITVSIDWSITNSKVVSPQQTGWCGLKSILTEVSCESPRYWADNRASFGLRSIVLLTSQSTTYFDEGTMNNQV